MAESLRDQLIRAWKLVPYQEIRWTAQGRASFTATGTLTRSEFGVVAELEEEQGASASATTSPSPRSEATLSR